MKSIILLFCIQFLGGCASTASLYFADRRVQEISIGMTRNEVINIMGKAYIVNSSSKDAHGNLAEVLVYKSSNDEEYRLKFQNSVLESWNRVHLREYIRPEALVAPPASGN